MRMVHPKFVVTRQMVRDANARLIARSSLRGAEAPPRLPLRLSGEMIDRAGRIAFGSLKRG